MDKDQMKITTIAFDGDDTLWHHENYFSETKARFHTLMNELGDYPDAEEQASERHIANIPLWGYGVKSFTLAMVETAITLTSGKIIGSDIERIMDIGRSLYEHPVILLDHVAETIQALHGQYRLLLITKGDLLAQEMKIAQSKLAPFFEGIEIVSEKNVETYERVFKRYGLKAGEVLMVGNSVKSDILPPIMLGAQAIHIPYYVTWKYEQVETTETEQGKFMVLPDIKELPRALQEIEKNSI
jgi:putative hydrolase of the HAD superfamily